MQTPPGFRSIPLTPCQLRLDTVLRCGQSFLWHVYPLSSSSLSSPSPATTSSPSSSSSSSASSFSTPATTAANGSPSVKKEDEGEKGVEKEKETETEKHQEPTHEYRLCLLDRLVCLRQGPQHLFYRAVFPPSSPSSSSFSTSSTSPTTSPAARATPDEADDVSNSTLTWLQSYFQLTYDLPALYSHWSSQDPIFARISARSNLTGIVTLRQDPWECLLSFICSQNNHISRITKMVHSLPLNYSKPLVEVEHPTNAGEKVVYYPFPEPEALAAPEVEQKLRELGFGYRAKYIQKTAAMIASFATSSTLSQLSASSTSEGSTSTETPKTGREYLLSLRAAPLPDARAALLALPGVGPKVADCVLLMSLDKTSVIPVDTHVLQIAERWYGLKQGKGKGMTPALYEAVGDRLRSVWGERAGWAQTVMFAGDLRMFAEKAEGATIKVEVKEEDSVQVQLPLSPTSENGTDTPPVANRRKTAVRTAVAVETPTKQRRLRNQIPPTPDSLPSQGKKRKVDYFEIVEEEELADLSTGTVTKIEEVVKVELSEVNWDIAGMAERVKLRRRRAVVRP